MITLESSRDELHVVVVGVRPGRDDVEARFPDLADTELQVERRERERRQDLFWLPAERGKRTRRCHRGPRGGRRPGRRHRYAAVEEPGGDVVAEVVETDGLQADLLPQLGEAAGGAGVGPPRQPAGDVAGEDVGIGDELGLADLGPVLHPRPLLLERFHRSGIEGDPPAPVGLRLLLHHFMRAERQGAGDEDFAVLQVDVRPLERAELAAPGAGDGRQPEVDREVRVVLVGGGQEPGDLFGRRRADRRRHRPGPCGQRRRVLAQHPPPHRLLQSGPEDRMDLQHAGRAEVLS